MAIIHVPFPHRLEGLTSTDGQSQHVHLKHINRSTRVSNTEYNVAVHRMVISFYIKHVPPSIGMAIEQRLVVRQSGIVNAHVHPLIKGLDSREHGQDLLLVAQVTLIRDQTATVTGTLAFRRQLL